MKDGVEVLNTAMFLNLTSDYPSLEKALIETNKMLASNSAPPPPPPLPSGVGGHGTQAVQNHCKREVGGGGGGGGGERGGGGGGGGGGVISGLKNYVFA